MARVSLGVILPGNPKCVQKQNFFVKILGFICRVGGIFGVVAMLACFILSFAIDDGMDYIYSMFRWTGVMIIMLLVFFGIWDEKRRCEYCHHFFTLHRISDDVFIGSSESTISRKTYDTSNGVLYDFKGNSTMFSSTRTSREYGKEITNKYTYNVRCRCCGAVSKVEKTKTTKQY